jgi:dTDP-4-dehydrorhamnose reductase
MRIFIIGASGLVGNNCMDCMRKDPDFTVIGSHYSYPTEKTEYFNVFDPLSSSFDLSKFKPDVIIHTGALTHVDYCELHPEESFHHTVESTHAAIKLAKKEGAKFVYVSSDYIFDGEKGPYSEQAATHPLSIYGKHKLMAENAVKGSGLDHLILRITNVYGKEERGKNFVAFLVKTALAGESKTLRLPVDQFATPVNAADIGRALCLLLKNGKTGIYNLASDEYLSRVELARKVLAHFPDTAIDVNPVLTKDLGQAAPRPLQGGLTNDKIKHEFPGLTFGTVDDYIKETYGL